MGWVGEAARGGKPPGLQALVPLALCPLPPPPPPSGHSGFIDLRLPLVFKTLSPRPTHPSWQAAMRCPWDAASELESPQLVGLDVSLLLLLSLPSPSLTTGCHALPVGCCL